MLIEIIIIIFLVTFDFLLELFEISIFSIQDSFIDLSPKKTNQLQFLKKNMIIFVMISILLENIIHLLISFNLIYIINNLNFFLQNIISILFSFITIYLTMLARVIAIKNKEKTISYLLNIFYLICKTFYCIGYIMDKISNFTLKLFNISNVNLDEIDNIKKEIKSLLQNQKEDEFKILKHILDIKNIQIYKIMTPRSEFVTIDINDVNFTEKLLEMNYIQNIIVEDNEIIIGIINIRNYFEKIAINKNINIKSLIIEPKYIINSLNLYKVSNILKNEVYKFLFVIDEYGEIEGIVTESDVIAEIFGESKEDEEYLKKTPNGTIVSGNYNIRNLNRKMNWDLPDEEITISGFLIYLVKKIPYNGEKIIYKNFIFHILKSQRNKINKILIQLFLEE